MLAGHLDTVPPGGNEVPRVDGDTVWGVGASDMKGGLAVMLDLATTVHEPAVDVTWCFYAREEIGRDESGLLELWRTRPDLLAGDAAVLGEPTSALVEAGCQGTMRVRITLRGRAGPHGAALHGPQRHPSPGPAAPAGGGLGGREVVLDGCTYAEQLQVVAVEGGVAANVVPDEAPVTLNHRYAPDRGQGRGGGLPARAPRPARSSSSAGDTWELLDAGDGAPPSLDHPLLKALVEQSGRPPKAKVGWTDVASFWEHGVPAANFGPGDPFLAHHPDERVTTAALEQARGRAARRHHLTPSPAPGLADSSYAIRCRRRA